MWTNSFHSKGTKQLWDLLKMGATQKNKLGAWQNVESRVLWVCTPNGCVYIRASMCTLGTFALSGVPSLWISLLVWLLVPRALGLAFTASLCWSFNQGAWDCWCFCAPEPVCWAYHCRKLRFFSWISGSPNNSGHSLKLHYFFQARKGGKSPQAPGVSTPEQPLPTKGMYCENHPYLLRMSSQLCNPLMRRAKMKVVPGSGPGSKLSNQPCSC